MKTTEDKIIHAKYIIDELKKPKNKTGLTIKQLFKNIKENTGYWEIIEKKGGVPIQTLTETLKNNNNKIFNYSNNIYKLNEKDINGLNPRGLSYLLFLILQTHNITNRNRALLTKELEDLSLNNFKRHTKSRGVSSVRGSVRHHKQELNCQKIR